MRKFYSPIPSKEIQFACHCQIETLFVFVGIMLSFSFSVNIQDTSNMEAKLVPLFSLCMNLLSLHFVNLYLKITNIQLLNTFVTCEVPCII